MDVFEIDFYEKYEVTLAYYLINGNFSKYYDCSNRTIEQWKATGQTHPFVFLMSTGLGILIMSTYIPCLIVIKRQLKRSCYKIMFALGILDLLNVLSSCFLSGYLALVGDVFCTNPLFNFYHGAMVCGFWCASLHMCIVLAINRLVALTAPSLHVFFFRGNRTYLTMMLPLFVFVTVFLLTPPVLYNSGFNAWMMNPMIGYSSDIYLSPLHTLNNVIAAIAIPAIYGLLCIKLWFKHRTTADSGKQMKQQAVLQCALICMLNCGTAYLYCYIQVHYSQFAADLANFSWQMSNGIPPLIYLCLNREIRRKVLAMFNLRSSTITGFSSTAKTPVGTSPNVSTGAQGRYAPEELVIEN